MRWRDVRARDALRGSLQRPGLSIESTPLLQLGEFEADRLAVFVDGDILVARARPGAESIFLDPNVRGGDCGADLRLDCERGCPTFAQLHDYQVRDPV